MSDDSDCADEPFDRRWITADSMALAIDGSIFSTRVRDARMLSDLYRMLPDFACRQIEAECFKAISLLPGEQTCAAVGARLRAAWSKAFCGPLSMLFMAPLHMGMRRPPDLEQFPELAAWHDLSETDFRYLKHVCPLLSDLVAAQSHRFWSRLAFHMPLTVAKWQIMEGMWAERP